MTLYDSVFESLQNRVNSGELTLEEAQIINDMAYDRYVTEKENKRNPLKDCLAKLKKIKDTKPSEFDDDDTIKEFVDKHYSDIENTAKLLEEEPEKITKKERDYIVRTILVLIAMVVSVPMTMSMVLTTEIAGSTLMGIAVVIYLIDTFASNIIHHARVNTDLESMKNLTKIKDALSKVKTDKLPDNYKKKIAKLKEKINDAETSIYTKFKEVKESAYEEIADSLQHKIDCGELTLEEAEMVNIAAYEKYILA